MEKIAVYPGSFDPITNGHLDIIKRSARIFDKVYVSVLINSSKSSAFSMEERMEMIKEVTKDFPNVEVDSFDGLLVNYVKEKNASVVVRGLRAITDFEYEFQMALMNRKLQEDIETLFMMTSGKYSYLSSSVVKEIASHGGCLKDLVPDTLIEKIENKLRRK